MSAELDGAMPPFIGPLPSVEFFHFWERLGSPQLSPPTVSTVNRQMTLFKLDRAQFWYCQSCDCAYLSTSPRSLLCDHLKR